MITMNDRALYQLERAIDALSTMAKIMREDQQDNHSPYWFDYNRNDRNRTDPFNWHSGAIGSTGATGSSTYTTSPGSNAGPGPVGSLYFGSASPDVITFS